MVDELRKNKKQQHRNGNNPSHSTDSPLFHDNHNHSNHNLVKNDCDKPGCENCEEEKLRIDTVDAFNYKMPTNPAERKKALFQLLQFKFAQMSDFEKLVTFLTKFGEESTLHSWSDGGHSIAHWAAKRVDTQALEILRPHSVDFHVPTRDQVKMYPIHWAATEGSIKTLGWLLENGKVPEMQMLNARDASGCTPLLIAAQYGFADLVGYLIQKGADVRAVDNNEDSALHWAAYRGDSNVVGLLLHMNGIDMDSRDLFGQTPLHLAAIRGNTEVVQYLLYDAGCTHNIKDAKGKTPFDLAASKKKTNVMLVFETYEKNIIANSSFRNRLVQLFFQMISPKEWKSWLIGGGTGDVGQGTNNRLPFLLNVSSTILAGTLFLKFFGKENYNMMADKSGVLLFSLLAYIFNVFCFVMVYKSNPGVLDVKKPKTNQQRRTQHCDSKMTMGLSALTSRLQEQYRQALLNLDKDMDGNRPQLCHSCHIVRPLRSKHCRVLRRCVLMFDHFCPFVGNSIGLYNYVYFYLYCLSFVTADIFILYSSIIYLRRIGFDWYILIVALYTGCYIFPSGFMCVYHTQLVTKNLTTNEQENAFRYDHFKDRNGRFRNPFDKGYLHNIYTRCIPSEQSYSYPLQLEEELKLLNGDELV